jgi:hypothetical protein
VIRKKPKAFIGEIVDEEDFLAPQSQSSYDFGARGTRPFIAKTDADGRVAITIVGTTTVGTPVQKTARSNTSSETHIYTHKDNSSM